MTLAHRDALERDQKIQEKIMTNHNGNNRVYLRPLKSCDSEALYKWLKDGTISRTTMVPHPYTRDKAAALIRQSCKLRRTKTGEILAVIDKESDQCIGMIGLQIAESKARRGEIGFWLAKSFWGKGLMTEAVELALKIGFTAMKLHKIHAYVFEGNVGSVKVLEKCGFTQEGFFRRHMKHYNRYRNMYYFGILKKEWLARRK